MDEREELLALIRAAREHIEYYKEIGVTHAGGYVEAAAKHLETEDMPKKSKPTSETPTEQASLFDFGEPEPRKPSPSKPVSAARIETLDDIRKETGNCCDLCNGRINLVFGEGNPKADLLFIGEGPGADEDATGRPFVGAAGKLLDKIIEAIGLKRGDVYITNVVKCRPPNNRKPTTEEIAACEPFMFREIDVVKPKVIVTLGATPLFSLLRVKEGITKVRGSFYSYKGIPVMATFHPAFLLRVPERKREVWEDMKQVKTRLEEINKAS